MKAESALEIKGLTKNFGGFKLDGLSLTLPKGCIMGLVGENGAGKSTTIRLIINALHKDGGSVSVLGHDSEKDEQLVKEEIGVVPDEVGLPGCLTAAQTGKVMSRVFANWDDARYRELTERFSLPADKPFGEFSKGMKMKLGIAVAMAHRARLLLLDEATSGLDPVARDDILQILTDFTREEENSVLISSHIVSDLEKLCDYVAFLHKGRLMLFEEKDALTEEYGVLRCTEAELGELCARAPEAVKYRRVTPYGAEALVLKEALPHGGAAAAGAGDLLGAAGAGGLLQRVSPVSLEELFVMLSKEEA